MRYTLRLCDTILPSEHLQVTLVLVEIIDFTLDKGKKSRESSMKYSTGDLTFT